MSRKIERQRPHPAAALSHSQESEDSISYTGVRHSAITQLREVIQLERLACNSKFLKFISRGDSVVSNITPRYLRMIATCSWWSFNSPLSPLVWYLEAKNREGGNGAVLLSPFPPLNDPFDLGQGLTICGPVSKIFCEFPLQHRRCALCGILRDAGRIENIAIACAHCQVWLINANSNLSPFAGLGWPLWVVT